MKTKENRFYKLSNAVFFLARIVGVFSHLLIVEFVSHLPADTARYSFVTPIIIFVTKKNRKVLRNTTGTRLKKGLPYL